MIKIVYNLFLKFEQMRRQCNFGVDSVKHINREQVLLEIQLCVIFKNKKLKIHI